MRDIYSEILENSAAEIRQEVYESCKADIRIPLPTLEQAVDLAAYAVDTEISPLYDEGLNVEALLNLGGTEDDAAPTELEQAIDVLGNLVIDYHFTRPYTGVDLEQAGIPSDIYEARMRKVMRAYKRICAAYIELKLSPLDNLSPLAAYIAANAENAVGAPAACMLPAPPANPWLQPQASGSRPKTP